MSTAAELKRRPKQRQGSKKVKAIRARKLGLVMSRGQGGWLVTICLVYESEAAWQRTQSSPMLPRFQSKRAAAQALVGLSVAYETDGKDVVYFMISDAGNPKDHEPVSFAKVCNVAGL